MNMMSLPYPGEGADAGDLVRLADEYRMAARALLPLGRKGEPLSRAPARLCAIHAIELYLSAYLMRSGDLPRQIRALSHDLAQRRTIAVERGLKLRGKTAQHLQKMTEDREYLIWRYGPEMATTGSELTRLAATLDEVAEQVRQAMAAPAPS